MNGKQPAKTIISYCLTFLILSVRVTSFSVPQQRIRENICRKYHIPLFVGGVEVNQDVADDKKDATQNDDDDTSSRTILDPNIALNDFLSFCEIENEKCEGSIKILPKGYQKIAPHQTVHSTLFSTSDGICIVAIVADSDLVDQSKLESALSKPVQIVPAEKIQPKCGFYGTSIPPLGHVSKETTLIVLDQTVSEKCAADDLLILGGGGYEYWQSLVTLSTLHSQPNLQIQPITASDESTGIAPTTHIRATSMANDLMESIPFTQLPSPPDAIAAMVAKNRGLSNPLSPTVITVTGRVGKIHSKAKRTAKCELVPIVDLDEKQTKNESLPWQSANGVDLSLQLVLGKPLMQRIGPSNGEAAITNLKEDLPIEVQAMTNVGNRDSLARWVDNRILELTVLDYRILESSQSTKDNDGEEKEGFTKRYKHKPRSPGGTISAGLAPLKMEDIFENVEICLVDDMTSLGTFMTDFEHLQTLLKSSDETHDPSPLLGVDCEWQPSQFMETKGPQPVLLMQISIHEIGKVYLFDFQALFRPLLGADESMNDLETAVSETLADILSAKSIIKTGYQLLSDMRRIAASYPHIPCFRTIESVVEVSTLIKRILHITKQKKSRAVTMSLAGMTSHYLQRTIEKECQLSDWSLRPLSDDQLSYAALDAAVSPKLVEVALSTIDAKIDTKIPLIGRWDDDDGLKKEILSWNFIPVEDGNEEEISSLNAKRMVGNSWIATQSWIAGTNPPGAPSSP